MRQQRLRLFYLILILLPIIETNIVNAQNNTSLLLEDVLEQLAGDNEEEMNWANVIEDLTDRIKEPLNLNTATRQQLEELNILTDIQIENIQAYIYQYGQMQTIYELQLVEDMDKQTIEYLKPFVYVSTVSDKEELPKLRRIFKYGKNELLSRIDIPFYERKGYTGRVDSETTYLGHPMYHSLRYAFRYKDIVYAGLTAEKDGGEPLFALHNRKGYDFYSLYFYVRNICWINTLAIGNYRLSFGQGLIISNDFVLGKTSSLNTLFYRNNSIKKHSSTDEYNYFRGIATAVNLGKFIFSGFYSNRNYDGIVTDDKITSIQKTGLHRSRRETDRKNAFTMQTTGGNITYNGNYLKAGITGIYYLFDRPYYPQVREYSKYNLKGNYFANLGVDYKYRLDQFTFAGEIAMDKKKSVAMINSVNYSLSPDYNFTVIHRYYAHDYWAFFAQSFSEGGYVQNENGWYFAAEITPIKRWRFFTSIDLVSFPWWKYRIDNSSQAIDFMFQSTYTPNKKLTMYARYRFKKKDRNYTDEDKVKTVRPFYQHRFRYQLRYTPTDDFNLRTSLDFNSVNSKGVAASRGYQVVQAVSYSFNRLKLRTELQGSYFHTDDYDSRVYSYEKGLLYTFYTPSYYGKGFRIAAHLRWDFYKKCMIIAKLGQTTYKDRNEIGSGQDIIESNKKTDLQLQLRISF